MGKSFNRIALSIDEENSKEPELNIISDRISHTSLTLLN
jgi:hypothetical protein